MYTGGGYSLNSSPLAESLFVVVETAPVVLETEGAKRIPTGEEREDGEDQRTRT